jgi:hypothetical protein
VIAGSVARTIVITALTVAAFLVLAALGTAPVSRASVYGGVLFAVLFVLALALPRHRELAVRTMAGSVAALYAVYFGAELWQLLGGERQTFAPGRPSALMANIALLVVGVPLFRYAVTGKLWNVDLSRLLAHGDPSENFSDARALDVLSDAGAHLSVPTDVAFYLEFPSEAHATSAASVVQREGNRANVVTPPGGARALCVAHRQLVPTPEAIRDARERYTSLARDLGGRFEGWEAEVQPAND